MGNWTLKGTPLTLQGLSNITARALEGDLGTRALEGTRRTLGHSGTEDSWALGCVGT